MDQLNELENTFIEEYESALILFNAKKFKSSLILFSKALFALVDYFIFIKYYMLPKNHSERFRILKNSEMDVYLILDNVWRTYVDSYNKPSFNNSLDKLKSAILEIINLKNETFSEKIKKITEE